MIKFGRCLGGLGIFSQATDSWRLRSWYVSERYVGWRLDRFLATRLPGAIKTADAADY